MYTDNLHEDLLQFNEGLRTFIKGDFLPGLYSKRPVTYLIGIRVDTHNVCIFVVPEYSQVLLVLPELFYPESYIPVSLRLTYPHSMLETLGTIRQFLAGVHNESSESFDQVT